MPIVLNVRFHNLIAVVVFEQLIRLVKRGDAAYQEISESVPGADSTVAAVEGQGALRILKIGVLLVFLGSNVGDSEQQVVTADNLCQVVFIGEGGVGIGPRE